MKSGNVTWRRGELIKKGNNCWVYQGFNIDTGQIIAIKTIHVFPVSPHAI